MSDIYKLQYGATKSIHKYKYFKWVLSGRWNQGSGNSGSTATYMEWDELGIGFDNSAVCYGPDYWTFDSYTLDGTPWSPDTRMPPVLLGGTWGTEASKFDASNFVSLVVYFHTTSGETILPTSIGLYSTSNQNEYQSSTPLHFILSGLNEETNVYEQLIDIGAAEVNKGNTQLTTINSGFTYHYDVINLNRLIYPGWNGYVSYEDNSGPQYEYTTLWTGTTASVTGDNQLTQSITYNDNIGNYDFVDVYYWCGKDGQCCRRIPVIASSFNCGVMWPEGHATGNYNWFKMCMSGVGTTGYKRGGHSRTTALGDYTYYNGGMWSQGQFYKVVGIKEI